MLEVQQFLSRFRISEERFKVTGLVWESLNAIYEDHQSRQSELTITGNTIAERLRQIPSVHSLKMRVKNSEHLLDKIIRKKEKEPDRIIDVNTYRSEITDLVGVRALHLYGSSGSRVGKLRSKCGGKPHGYLLSGIFNAARIWHHV